MIEETIENTNIEDSSTTIPFIDQFDNKIEDAEVYMSKMY